MSLYREDEKRQSAVSSERNAARNALPPNKVAPFLKLYAAVQAVEGSERKACAALGVGREVVSKARSDLFLSPEQARRWLAGYKRWKAAR